MSNECKHLDGMKILRPAKKFDKLKWSDEEQDSVCVDGNYELVCGQATTTCTTCGKDLSPEDVELIFKTILDEEDTDETANMS